ncbi:MAG: hypothetical protein KBD78_15805 [Oligoflexales bacterium]|nr:hypothetical protein [Oligoflexales bacterium]
MKSTLLGILLVSSSASAQTPSCVGECVNLPNRNNVTVNVAGSGVNTPILDGAFYKAFGETLELISADRNFEYYLYSGIKYAPSVTDWDGTKINSTFNCFWDTDEFACKFTGTSSIVYPDPAVSTRNPYFHLQGNFDNTALANLFITVLKNKANDAESFIKNYITVTEENGAQVYRLKSLEHINYWDKRALVEGVVVAIEGTKMNENVMTCVDSADARNVYCEVELLDSQIPTSVSTTL